MARQLHNLHLDAIAFIRETTGCEYSSALRLGQLFAYLEHLTSSGVAVQFNQSAYCERTGCSRPGLRSDLQKLAAHGWIELHTSIRGPRIRVMGLPFNERREVPMAPEPQQPRCPHTTWNVTCGHLEQREPPRPPDPPPTEAPAPAQDRVPIWQTRPRPWKKAQREQIRDIWNAKRPPNFAPLAPDGLDADRAATLARSMDGRGGHAALVEKLPAVLEQLRGDPFWGDPNKVFSFDHFFGSVGNRKPHLAQALDRLAEPYQNLKPDRPKIRYEPFGHQWIPMRSGLKPDELLRAAIELVRDGGAPREALQHIGGNWRPDHPLMDLLNDKPE